MSIFGRSTQPAAATPDPPEDQAPEDQAPDPDPVTDLTTLAAQHRTEAEQDRQTAAALREDAAAALAEAEQEAARIIADARDQARKFGALASTADRHAAGLDMDARRLDLAVAGQAKAAEAEQRVSELEAELASLVVEIADHDAVIAQAADDRTTADGQLTEARQAGDVGRIRDRRAEIEALDDLAADRTDKRARAHARMAAVGNGTDAFPGELLTVIAAAKSHHRAARDLLNEVFPERTEAVQDRAMAEFRAAWEGNLERIAEEAQRPGPPRTIVNSTPTGVVVTQSGRRA